MKKAAKLLQNKCVYYVKAVIIVKHTSNERFMTTIKLKKRLTQSKYTKSKLKNQGK